MPRESGGQDPNTEATGKRTSSKGRAGYTGRRVHPAQSSLPAHAALAFTAEPTVKSYEKGVTGNKHQNFTGNMRH